jgi:ethanolamine utilization protein EutQ (cupin superfamily)
MSEEEQAEIEAAWEEEYFEGMEELGWRNDDTEYILQGPLELSDEDGIVVAQGGNNE